MQTERDRHEGGGQACRERDRHEGRGTGMQRERETDMKVGGQACREKDRHKGMETNMQTVRQKWRYGDRHAGRETEMKLGRPSLQLCGQTHRQTEQRPHYRHKDKKNKDLTTDTKTKRTKASLQTQRQREQRPHYRHTQTKRTKASL